VRCRGKVLHRSADALLYGREGAEADGIGGTAVVNGVLNGAITGAKEGGQLQPIKEGAELWRGPRRWGLSMVQE
jgi:hypothetical protein